MLIAANISTDKCRIKMDELLFQLPLLTAFKVSSQVIVVVSASAASRFSVASLKAHYSTSSVSSGKKHLPRALWRAWRSCEHSAIFCAALPHSISPNLQISHASLRFNALFMPGYAVDYIDACPKKSAIYRFFRALSPQLCYSLVALNTSVVLVGLW